jgi:AbiV family abortive infection protein
MRLLASALITRHRVCQSTRESDSFLIIADPVSGIPVSAPLLRASRLHPLIEAQARDQFLINRPEHGVSSSMREIKIRVRKLGRFGDEATRVDLMNMAFGPGGPLTEPTIVKGEHEGTRALFAGAYAVLRNPPTTARSTTTTCPRLRRQYRRWRPAARRPQPRLPRVPGVRPTARGSRQEWSPEDLVGPMTGSSATWTLACTWPTSPGPAARPCLAWGARLWSCQAWRMTRAIPPSEDLVTLIQACLRNAEGLLADARLLLNAERVPRAHALATLALEEIGKSCVCVLGLFPMPVRSFGIRSDDDFWAAWTSHTDKLLWARGLLSLLIREPDGPVLAAVERLADAARGEHLRKMRGLYVDYADGSVLLPTDITDAEARELISDVQAVLDIAMEAWCHEAVRDRLRDLQQQHLAEFNSMMASALQVLQADPDNAIAITRQLLHGDGQTAD